MRNTETIQIKVPKIQNSTDINNYLLINNSDDNAFEKVVFYKLKAL